MHFQIIHANGVTKMEIIPETIQMVASLYSALLFTHYWGALMAMVMGGLMIMMHFPMMT